MTDHLTDNELIETLEGIIRDPKTPAAPKIAAIKQLREIRGSSGGPPPPTGDVGDADPFAALDELAPRRYRAK